MSLTRRLLNQTADEGPETLGFRLRARRIAPLLNMVEVAHSQHGHVRILDVGGRVPYWDILPRDYLDTRDVAITIVNLPETPMPNDHGRFEFIAADACRLDMFEDGSFDIAHSNSVLEHVGDWERQVAFSREIARVAPSYFVQTPNFWFPIDPHYLTPFVHWLPEPVRARLVLRHDRGNMGLRDESRTVDSAVRVVEGLHPLDRRMLQALFEEAHIVEERFLGLPKSLVAIKQ